VFRGVPDRAQFASGWQTLNGYDGFQAGSGNADVAAVGGEILRSRAAHTFSGSH
jgi:hypothetical protein